MVRSALSRVMWVGRATVFLVGLAVILAVVVGLASTALAHTGVDKKLFHLGHNNPVAALSKLTGSVANGVLQVTNTSTANTTQDATAIGATNNSISSPAMRATNAGRGTALELNVTCPISSSCFKPAPMKVNSDTKVQNLNSDELDGKDSGDFLPAGGSLPSGMTLRGNFEIDADADEDTSTLGANSVASNAISFGFALASAPQAHTIDVSETPPPECPGTASSPEAAPGHLCIYESYEENERDPGLNHYPDTLNTTRYGTGLYTQSQSAGRFFVSRGTWAVTAP